MKFVHTDQTWLHYCLPITTSGSCNPLRAEALQRPEHHSSPSTFTESLIDNADHSADRVRQRGGNWGWLEVAGDHAATVAICGGKAATAGGGETASAITLPSGETVFLDPDVFNTTEVLESATHIVLNKMRFVTVKRSVSARPPTKPSDRRGTSSR